MVVALAGLFVCAIAVGGAARADTKHHQSARGHSQHRRSSNFGDAGGWHGFGAGSWPRGSWRPYAKSSPFNQQVASAQPVGDSKAIVREVLSRFGEPAPLVAGAAGTANDFGHPIYYSQRTDPKMTLNATQSWGSNPLDGVEIPVPARARPAGGDEDRKSVV